MREDVTLLVWCEDCAREDWDQVSNWCWYGFAVSRSGVVKEETSCDYCGEELDSGARVEAIVIDHREPEAVSAMREQVVLDTDVEEALVGADGV